jgi:hypothetical protein
MTDEYESTEKALDRFVRDWEPSPEVPPPDFVPPTGEAITKMIREYEARGVKTLIIHPQASDEVWKALGVERPTYYRAFTRRSWVRRALEWAAQWLGYYVR